MGWSAHSQLEAETDGKSDRISDEKQIVGHHSTVLATTEPPFPGKKRQERFYFYIITGENPHWLPDNP